MGRTFIGEQISGYMSPPCDVEPPDATAEIIPFSPDQGVPSSGGTDASDHPVEFRMTPAQIEKTHAPLKRLKAVQDAITQIEKSGDFAIKAHMPLKTRKPDSIMIEAGNMTLMSPRGKELYEQALGLVVHAFQAEEEFLIKKLRKMGVDV